MNLNAKSLGLAGGVLWAATMFVMTILSIWIGYGTTFLESMASVYPGYEISHLGILVGTVYGFFDGFIGFFVIGWLYNVFNK